MGEIPKARVVRGSRSLAAPPRRIPAALWVHMMFGGFPAQILWFAIGLASFLVPGKPHENTPPLAWWWTGVLLLLFAPMLAMIAVRQRRRLYMLRHGIETTGTIVRSYEEGRGKYSAWVYVFEYRTTDGATRQVKIRSVDREPSLEDDRAESLVYDPTGEREATTLDNLAGAPKIGPDGELVARVPFFLHLLLGPALTLGVILGSIALALPAR